VICDRRSQSCSDETGTNAVLTRRYFSKRDTHRVKSWMDADRFWPRAGVACDRGTQTCTDRHGPNVDLTGFYLGRPAGPSLADPQNGADYHLMPPANGIDVPDRLAPGSSPVYTREPGENSIPRSQVVPPALQSRREAIQAPVEGCLGDKCR
jgi:hypothetical protein